MIFMDTSLQFPLNWFQLEIELNRLEKLKKYFLDVPAA
jgi:hypothetical protein